MTRFLVKDSAGKTAVSSISGLFPYLQSKVDWLTKLSCAHTDTRILADSFTCKRRWSSSPPTCPWPDVWVTRKCYCDTVANERKADLVCRPLPKLLKPQIVSFVCFCLPARLHDHVSRTVKQGQGVTIRQVTVESQLQVTTDSLLSPCWQCV